MTRALPHSLPELVLHLHGERRLDAAETRAVLLVWLDAAPADGRNEDWWRAVGNVERSLWTESRNASQVFELILWARQILTSAGVGWIEARS